MTNVAPPFGADRIPDAADRIDVPERNHQRHALADVLGCRQCFEAHTTTRYPVRVAASTRPSLKRICGSGVLYVILCAAAPSLAVLWTFVLLNLLLRENFPFSHFPMYAGLLDFTDYVYLTDEHDQPIATRRFGLSASTLKKLYHARIRGGTSIAALRKLSVEELRPAGREVLQSMLARPRLRERPLTCRRLRLHQVNLRYRGGSFDAERFLVAEVPVC